MTVSWQSRGAVPAVPAIVRATVIVNPAAGPRRRDDVALRVSQALRAHGGDPRVLVTEGPGHGLALAREEAAAGTALVIAWGGDGTVNEVGTGLLYTPTRLGIVPAGSGNGLANALGIPRQPDRAVALALGGRDRRIDAGEIGGRLFFNVAGVGFDAHVAQVFSVAAARSRGLSGYVWTTLRELWRYRAESLRLEHGGSRTEERALIVAFANGSQYGNGARIAPGARLDDGALDLVVVRPGGGPLANLWRARRLFDGSLDRDPDAWRELVTEAAIEGERPMLFHVDGEPVQGPARLEVRVHPGALVVRSA